jgi:hypothetical protein
VSRQIDLSKKLSAEDREYLESRARHADIEQNERQFGKADVPEQVNDGHTGDVDPFKADDGTDLLAGTHPGEQPVNPIQRIEAQGISDLDDEDKDPDGLVPPNSEPTRQEGDGDDEPEPEKSDALGARTTGNDEDGDNYDDEEVWSYRDLQEEAKGRTDVSAAGSREEIIARLREDDQKSE